MTDLQMSLVAIGVAIVAAVVAYNKWHEIRARKHVERAFSAERDDVLMSAAVSVAKGERQEPVLVEQEMALLAETTMDFEPTIAAFETVVSASKVPEELPVDPMIDCVIPLVLETPIRGEKLLPLLQTLKYVGSKPVHFVGLPVASAAGEPQPEWQLVAYGELYAELRAGVQLSTRGGALNEIEYSEMIVRLRQIADEIEAELDIPDMPSVMAAARQVYQFVAQHDARLGINVRSNGAPWAVSTLLAVLERQGFDVRPDGRFVMQDGDGGILFALTTNETVAAENTSCLTLLLDVPRVAAERDGFGAMVACANSLAKRLDGTMVDDGNQPLSDPAIDEIAEQVRMFYDDMKAAGIPAGSRRALRLFI